MCDLSFLKIATMLLNIHPFQTSTFMGAQIAKNASAILTCGAGCKYDTCTIMRVAKNTCVAPAATLCLVYEIQLRGKINGFNSPCWQVRALKWSLLHTIFFLPFISQNTTKMWAIRSKTCSFGNQPRFVHSFLIYLQNDTSLGAKRGHTPNSLHFSSH